jgi:hypothetical protein
LKRKEDVMINHITTFSSSIRYTWRMELGIHGDKVGVPVVPGGAGAEAPKRATAIRKQWPIGMPVRCRSGERLILLGASPNEMITNEINALESMT